MSHTGSDGLSAPTACGHFCSEDTYRCTRQPIDLAHTLNPDAYRSQEYHAAERDAVFARSWVCVGYTSQLREPGATLVTTVADQPILLTCDHSGQINAFYNVCRHRGSMLIAADGTQKVIRCPYHSWGYSLSGELLGAPYFAPEEHPADAAACGVRDMQAFRKEDYGLLRVRVATWGCFIFVNLDSDARSLEDWLGDLPQRLANYPLDELVLHQRKTFEVEANWKLVAENFMEYYHLPWVHPELNTVSTLDNHQRFQGPGMYTSMCTRPLTVANLPIDPGVLPDIPGISEVDARTAYWVLIVPNIALFLLPHHLFTLVLKPDGIGRTIEYADLLVHSRSLESAGAESQIDAIFQFWDLVNRQDIAAVERVQRGLQARAYQGGRMCFQFEESIHRFQNIVIDLMTGQQRTPPGDELESTTPGPR